MFFLIIGSRLVRKKRADFKKIKFLESRGFRPVKEINGVIPSFFCFRFVSLLFLVFSYVLFLFFFFCCHGTR